MSRIKNIINEEILMFINESAIVSIKELADMIADRLGGGEMEANAFLTMLSNAFRRKGNEGVKDMYRDITGNELEDMSRGKFMFKEGITGLGGVLDRAAEKRFGIPNQHRELDRKANDAVNTLKDDSSNGTFVTKIITRKESSAVFLNPKSLKNFEPNVRALSTAEGDLFVMQNDIPIYHQEIIDDINTDTNYNIRDANHHSQTVTLHRIRDTNDFGYSISFFDFASQPRNWERAIYLFNIVKEKNPQFNFIRQYWQYL